jgi:hypothetical protein
MLRAGKASGDTPATPSATLFAASVGLSFK